jgi:hypothetical protein
VGQVQGLCGSRQRWCPPEGASSDRGYPGGLERRGGALPGQKVSRVVFPFSLEAFFVGEASAIAGRIEPEAPGATAAGRNMGKFGEEVGA